MLILVGTALTVNGKEKDSKNFKLEVMDQGKKVILMYNAPDIKKVKVEILKGNDVIFSERIHSGKFQRPYNLSGLKDGKYTLKISDGDGESTEEIEIKSNFYAADFQHVTIKKAFNSKDKIVITAMSGKDDVFKIKIYDENNNKTYTYYQDVKNSSGKVYRLKDAETINYTIEITNSEDKLLKKITL